jgi:3-phosphoglycerate kinase
LVSQEKNALKSGEGVVIENLRFHSEEEAGGLLSVFH